MRFPFRGGLMRCRDCIDSLLSIVLLYLIAIIGMAYPDRRRRRAMCGMRGKRGVIGAALVASFALPCRANAEEPSGHPFSIPRSTQVSVESLTLPGDESLGTIGVSLLFEAAPQWWVGPAVYGAVRGERGGLFVAGVEVQRRWSAGPLRFGAGLFAGGGGGADAPVGSGLMLRPSLTMTYPIGAFEAGLSWSQVSFPSGDIRSRQFGLVLGWDGDFRFTSPARAGQPSRDDRRSGLGIDRVVATGGSMALRDEGATRDVGLIGARFERRLGGGAFATVEGAAAVTGDAAGYMEILGGAGWRATLTDRWDVGARIAAGLGGGGTVPTGGGVIGRLALDTSWALGRAWRTGLEVAAVGAADGSARGTAWQWWIAADIEPAAPGYDPFGSGTMTRYDWVVVMQHAVDAERIDGTSAPLRTIGFKWNRDLGSGLYLSAQAHTAVAGDAGAYGAGLVGAGVRMQPAGASAWELGAEALVGAAGGGGVSTSGGAIAQALLWAGYGDAARGQWRLGVGATHALRGGLTTPVLELSWARAFGQAVP